MVALVRMEEEALRVVKLAVPIVTNPLSEMDNSVVEAELTKLAKREADEVSGPQTVSRLLGEVVPMPTLPPLAAKMVWPKV